MGAVGDARPAQLGAARAARSSPAARPARRWCCCSVRSRARSACAGIRRRRARDAPRARSATSAARRASSSATAERRRGRRRREGALALIRCRPTWPPATATRHARPGVSCSNCGRPICPDCMTHDPGRHALPGVLARQRTKVRDHARHREPSRSVTYALIAINVIVFLAEGTSVYSLERRSDRARWSTRAALIGSSPVAQPRRRRRRARPVLARRHERLPAREPAAHRLQHVGPLLLGMMLEPAIGSRALRWSIYFVSLLAGSFGALLVSPHVARPSAPRGRSSA